MSQTIRVLHLYPRDMNIYGDMGNILCLQKRLLWHGYDPEVIEYNPGDKWPNDIDLVVGGGGQDSGQGKIQKDLLKIGPKLIKLADKSTPMLAICGMYQLFGKFFKTIDGEVIQGIGLIDVKTYGYRERLIGNIITKSSEFGLIVGYENHSGQTFLGNGVQPLGIVQMGAGNNLKKPGEGARFKNVIGSYLHGSLLPKNPKIADFLIKTAVENKFGKGSFKPKDINNHYTEMARKVSLKRPR